MLNFNNEQGIANKDYRDGADRPARINLGGGGILLPASCHSIPYQINELCKPPAATISFPFHFGVFVKNHLKCLCLNNLHINPGFFKPCLVVPNCA
jgi:hypothetical protein